MIEALETGIRKQFRSGLQLADKLCLTAFLSVFNESAGIRGLLFHTVYEDVCELRRTDCLRYQGLTLEGYHDFFSHFLKRGYSFLEYSDLLHGLLPEKKYLYVTFDDGYFNNTRILPVIEDLNIPIHVFVNTNNILKSRKYWWDVIYQKRSEQGVCEKQVFREIAKKKFRSFEDIERSLIHEFGSEAFKPLSDLDRPLSCAELKNLSKHPLVTIGNHMHNHKIVPLLEREEYRNEVKTCSDVVREITGSSPSGFAFPNGDYRQADLEILDELGFDLAFTCQPQIYRTHDRAAARSIELMGRYGVSIRSDLEWRALSIRVGASGLSWARGWSNPADRLKRSRYLGK